MHSRITNVRTYGSVDDGVRLHIKDKELYTKFFFIILLEKLDNSSNKPGLYIMEISRRELRFLSSKILGIQYVTIYIRALIMKFKRT